MLLPAVAGDAAADFYLTRSQNPFTLFQGQPLPLPAAMAATGWSADYALDISNTLNVQDGAGQSLYVDFESYQLTARLAHRLAPRWSIILDVPVIHRGGGFLDNAIDGWHDTFGLPRASRPLVADNQYTIRYSDAGATPLSLTQGATRPGDIAAHIGYLLDDSDDHAVTLWAGIELPSGERAQLAGNDATDAHLGLAASGRSGDDWVFDANLGAVLPGGDLLANNPANNVVLYSYLAASWAWTERLLLRVQLESHQAYFKDDRLDLLAGATVIVFGGAIRLGACSRVDIGISEDIDVGASPDVSFLFTLVSRVCD